MLNRRTYFLLISFVPLLAVACLGTESNENFVETVVVTPDGPVLDETAEPPSESGSQPDPIATRRPNSTATPTAEAEETPESDTESVSFYLGGFRSINRGEYIDAERTFTTVIELEPRFARGWDGRGQSLMLQGKYEEAMLDFDRAIELKPNLAVAYSNRGLTRVALDDMDGAFRDASRAYELNDESVAAQMVLGRVYANRGETDTALAWFDLAIETDPKDGSTWWWRGRFYRDVMGLGNAALSDFNNAIEIAPSQGALYIDRALLYIQADVEPDLARADLEEAISLSQDPKIPSIIERAENLIEVLDELASLIQ
jgi:tetratricopeptide (TPR) repeat protein